MPCATQIYVGGARKDKDAGTPTFSIRSEPFANSTTRLPAIVTSTRHSFSLQAATTLIKSLCRELPYISPQPRQRSSIVCSSSSVP
jgi:hypothetical protein